MQCGIGHCGHCQLGPTLVCRDGPVYPWSELEPLAGDQGAVMDARKTDARGVEVRLLRRLPAEPARLRGRAADARRRARDRLLPGGDAARPSRAPTTSRSSRARSRPPHDAERIREVRRALARADHDRRVRDGRRHPGAAQLRRRRGLHVGRLRLARLHLDARTSTPISAHVPVDFELHGCPIDKHQLLEVIARAPQPAPAARARAQRLRRVQAPRHGLRDGRPRHAVPRPGHPRRLRRAVPRLRPRLLRLLRPDGDARTRRRSSARMADAGRRATSTSCASTARSTPGSAAFREASERHERGERTRMIRTDYLARVEGEGAMYVKLDGDEVERGQAAHLRAAALLRGASCAAARSPRRPTSPRGSAASAPSPTR